MTMINMLGKLIAVIVALVWINQAQETTKSQLSNSFPVSEEFEYLLSIIKNQQDRFSEISRNVLKLQDDNEALQQSQQKQEEMINTQQLQIEAYRDDYQSLQNELQTTKMKLGTNYVRWGRTSCPDTAELIYEGYAAKSYYTHSGGGVNYICLVKTPQWPVGVEAGFQGTSYIYGVEYQELLTSQSSLIHDDAPCTVCHVDGRGELLMIPGKRECPTNWTMEYHGLLVSQKSDQTKADYVCLDSNPETVAGGGSDTNGGLFYAVEADCGYSLPCPPYIDGFEIACVVCTH